jgi:Protein of unknown function (DUF3108)
MTRWISLLALFLLPSRIGAADADIPPVLHYTASWAGLPAARIDLALGPGGSHYRPEIEIQSEGLPHWFINFSGDATSEGDLAADGATLPLRYDALYTLRRNRDKHIALRVVDQAAGRLTLRAPEDSSRKPPLDETYRRNVLDPLSALTAIRHYLATHSREPGTGFTLPVFDGARRFDVIARIMPTDGDPKAAPTIKLLLSLRPIAGFKGESSEDGDPDTAPRDVELRFSDDGRLWPLYLRVHIAYLPLVVRFDRPCPALGACKG